MTEDEEIIARAVQWAQKKKDFVLEKTVSEENRRSAKECIFMAGLPGAGKTETVRRLELKKTFTVLEADEIRLLNPEYRGTTDHEKGNAHLIQKATSIGLDYCRKYCVEHEIAFVQDTTLSNRGSIDLIRKLHNKEWDVTIIFVSQDPLRAWEFAKERERKEGRNVPMESFAESLANIVDNLQRIRDKYPGVRIKVALKEGRSMKKIVTVEEQPVKSILVENGIVEFDKNRILELIRGKGL